MPIGFTHGPYTLYCTAGESHRDTLFSAIHLASLWKLRDQPERARELLSAALATAQAAYTPR